MQLKPYQQTALTTLAGFLEQAREGGDPAASFARAVDTDAGDRPSGDAKRSSTTRRYRPLKDLPDTPYVCVRIPTGGGKTVVAAHAVKVAGEHYLERDYPLALWLVPSNTIRRQTVEALKNRDHPYRQALDDAFEGRVQVFDITEFPCIRPTDLGGNACIVVGTIQTLRVEKTEGRKVYAHHEDLEPHFARINNPSPGLQRDQDGRPYYSFANLLYLHRPLLIVDEAHNAVTGLTREMQGRINPACIIEFTATPRPGSNVLYSVSARVLKQQQMIKLPIVLSAHSTWQGAVNGALAQRARLTEQAQGESDYVRPIVLFQAQNKDQEVTAQVLKRHLVDNEQLPENRIAVVTGDQRELDDIDLFDRHCPIEAVITVQALKEGWDCSFAYVFCSLAKVRSSTAVEQLLGRVLRMPYARRRRVDALNRAYAHVCEPNFIDAAVQLKDRLVDMGFGLEEAEDSIETPQLGLQCGEGRSASVPEPVRLRLESPLDPRSLPAAQRLHIKLMPDDPDTGEIRVEVGAPLDADTETRLLDLVGPEQRQQARAKLAFQRLQADRLASPAARRAPLELPRLCLKTAQGQLELVEPELFLDPGSWDLNAYPAVLSPQEFKPGEAYRSFEFDLDRDRGIRYTVASEEVSQPQLDGLETQWDEAVLARWLDHHCRADDLRQPQLLEFVRRVVADQLGHKRVPLGALVYFKYRLAKAIVRKLGEYRAQAREEGYQAQLFTAQAQVETSFDYSFRFSADDYPARNYYRGSYTFQHHYYGAHRVGELKEQGEEFDCARALDMQPGIEYWVRNLDSRPGSAFRLPLSKGWFYPDFVALLRDGRVLVVEYKGAQLIDKVSEREKANVGALWEAKSHGRALFLMAVKEKEGMGVYEQIQAKIGLADG